MELDGIEAVRLFKLLDADGNGSIEIDEQRAWNGWEWDVLIGEDKDDNEDDRYDIDNELVLQKYSILVHIFSVKW